MTELILDKAIQEAIASINGAAQFDEKQIVDEVLTATTFCYVPDDLTVNVEDQRLVGEPLNLPSYYAVKLLYLNFSNLIAAGVDRPKAIKIAAVRAGIILNGGWLAANDDPTRAKYTYRDEIIPNALESGSRIDPEIIVRKNERNETIEEAWSSAAEKQLKVDKAIYSLKGVRIRVPTANADFLTLYTALNKDELNRMIKYLPIMAHMAFTKFEHHYINNAYFQASYEKHFKSLKLDALIPAWNHADIIYPAVHWMGPFAMRVWCANLMRAKRMPRALAVKFPLVPAGTALIASTVAVLKAAGALPGFKVFYEVYDDQWQALLAAVQLIKDNPYAYHTRADLFGETSLEPTLNDAKVAAMQLAPAAQAFINRYAQGTDLARIMALKKHAEGNIGLLRRFETIFQGNATQTRTQAREKSLRFLLEGVRESDTVTAKGKVTEVDEDVDT